MKPFWTVADIVAERPCLDNATICGYFAGRSSLTMEDILALPALRDEYKVWMACRRGALPDSVYAAWQAAVLTRVITTYALPHPSTHTWAVQWLDGTDRTVDSATRAAWAAWAARATWAARAAEAAEVARVARAARAAGAAEVAEAAEAARAAECTQQVSILTELLRAAPHCCVVGCDRLTSTHAAYCDSCWETRQDC